MLVATDPAQSLYGEASLFEALPADQVTKRELRRNYRNTEQIAQFALASVYGADAVVLDLESVSARHPQLPEFATAGEPVQVVFADKWDAQALFITKEIERLVRDQVASLKDIAILYTQRAGSLNRLLGALEAQKIPALWVNNRDRETMRSISLLGDQVKLLTVHSAKGLQFPVVFLFGVEALRIPASIRECTAEEANRMRVAYVGMTRAMDLLYLTYTRPNPIIERSKELVEWCEYTEFPGDYV
jgi:superfamily I DNA/RNA helicase